MMSNKWVLVTGATGSIGGVISKELAREGYNLILTGRRTSALAVLEEMARAEGVEHVCVSCDLPDYQGLLVKAVGACPNLWGLVHCAAVVNKGWLWERLVEDWLAEFRTNAEGAYYATKIVAEKLVEQGTGGRIVLMSSINSFLAYNGRSSYSASKAAVNGLTRSLAIELGIYGVTVNAISLGNYVSPMFNSPMSPSALEDVRRHTPTGRLCEGDDVVGLVTFLISERAKQINGQTIIMDGGFTIYGGIDPLWA